MEFEDATAWLFDCTALLEYLCDKIRGNDLHDEEQSASPDSQHHEYKQMLTELALHIRVALTTAELDNQLYVNETKIEEGSNQIELLQQQISKLEHDIAEEQRHE